MPLQMADSNSNYVNALFGALAQGLYMQKLILIWCVLTRVVGMIMYLEHGNMYSDNVSGM